MIEPVARGRQDGGAEDADQVAESGRLRGFRFVAVDASGTVWRWVDEDLMWVREPEGAPSDVDDAGSPLTVH